MKFNDLQIFMKLALGQKYNIYQEFKNQQKYKIQPKSQGCNFRKKGDEKNEAKAFRKHITISEEAGKEKKKAREPPRSKKIQKKSKKSEKNGAPVLSSQVT